MEFYFVRHGQTNGNAARRHQAEDTPLSKVGQAQAAAVAQELKELNATHLLSSNLVRAIETARFISDATGLDMDLDASLIELGRPKHLVGNFHRGPATLWFYLRWFLGHQVDVSLGGETYEAVLERIATAQARLQEYPKDARVIVVSHSVFMNLFFAHTCSPRPMGPWQGLKTFIRVSRTKNTSVWKVQYDPDAPAGTCAWRLEQST